MNNNQRFGNALAGFLGILLVFSVVMFFVEGCQDPINQKEVNEESFDPSDWILFK